MRAKVFVIATLASVAGTVVAVAPSASAESTTSAFTSRLVTLVNDARAQHGLRALTVASGTTTVAAGWSSHMASTATLAHNPNLQSQLESHGSPNWTTYGENVGEGPSSSADQLFTAYMNSPEHKANILGSGYRYLGIATTFSGGTAWNTMDFVDQYSGSSTTTTYAPVHHYTAPAPVHHYTAPKPATHPVAHKPASRPAPRHQSRTQHSVVAQHVHAFRHVDAQRPHTDVLLAGSVPVHVGTGGSGSQEPRLLVSLVAAALIAAAGLSWGLRRRVVA